MRSEVEQQIGAAGLTDRFSLTTAKDEDEMAELLALMTVTVLCSKVEGSPNVVMEAMAAGRAVVAAKVGGVPELIDEGVTGRLIDSRSPADFADAIAGLLNNPEEAARMGAAAASFVRGHLNVDRMVDEYAALYAELLERVSSSAGKA